MPFLVQRLRCLPARSSWRLIKSKQALFGFLTGSEIGSGLAEESSTGLSLFSVFASNVSSGLGMSADLSKFNSPKGSINKKNLHFHKIHLK